MMKFEWNELPDCLQVKFDDSTIILGMRNGDKTSLHMFCGEGQVEIINKCNVVWYT